MKTTSLKKNDIKHNWYLIDCTGLILGRFASQVAKILQGKNKVNYAPNLNNGDKVILINTSKVLFTGQKLKNKLYRSHSGYLGNLKETTLEIKMKKNPNFVVKNAISKMLPKNRMRKLFMRNLYCYSDDNYLQKAQNPVKLDITSWLK